MQAITAKGGKRVQTAEALAAQFRRLGFEPGVPPGIGRRSVMIDKVMVLKMTCPGCRRHQAMKYQPFRRGTDYRVLAACACGAGEEV
jgi:hypothetical protein